MTGGAGYIGSHTCKALSRAGYSVVVFDNLVAGHRDAVRYGDLVEGDITDLQAVRSALQASSRSRASCTWPRFSTWANPFASRLATTGTTSPAR